MSREDNSTRRPDHGLGDEATGASRRGLLRQGALGAAALAGAAVAQVAGADPASAAVDPHAATHAAGGSDPVAPGAIQAAAFALPNSFTDNNEFRGGGPGGMANCFSWFTQGNPGYPVGYVDYLGRFYMLTAMNLNNAYPSNSGYNRTQAASDKQYTLSVWTDVSGTPTGTSVFIRSNPNGPDLLVGADSFGYRRLRVNSTGALSWAPAGTGGDVMQFAKLANDAPEDVWLFRPGPRLLQVGDNAAGQGRAGCRFAINADLGGALDLQPHAADTRGLTVKAFAAQAADLLQIRDPADTIVSRVDKTGFFMTRKTSAPADADLSNSEVALWLSDLPGATTVNFKAKDSAGTVRAFTIGMSSGSTFDANTWSEEQTFSKGATLPFGAAITLPTTKAPWRMQVLAPDTVTYPNWRPFVLGYNFNREGGPGTSDDPNLPVVEFGFENDFAGRMEFNVNCVAAVNSPGGPVGGRPFGISYDYLSGDGGIFSDTRPASAAEPIRHSLAFTFYGQAWDGGASRSLGISIQNVIGAIGDTGLVFTEVGGGQIARLRRTGTNSTFELGPVGDVKFSWNGRAALLQLAGRVGVFHGIICVSQSLGGPGSWNVFNNGAMVQYLQSSAAPGQTINASSGQTLPLVVWNDSAGNNYSSISKSGYFMTRKQAPPGDGDIVAGELAIWLDATVGATKVMFKARDKAGAVRTGSVALGVPT